MGRRKTQYSPARVRELDNRVLLHLAAHCLAKGDEASADNCFRELMARPETREMMENAVDDYRKSQFQKLTGVSKPPTA